MQGLSSFLDEALSQILEQAVIKQVHMQGGGDINAAAVLNTTEGNFFIKWNKAELADMFEQEAKGLVLLHNTGVIQAPTVCGSGIVEDKSFLILEYLQRGRASEEYWTDLGENLAKMHLIKAERFGLDHDNYIGRLTQSNAMCKDWVAFYREERLMPQLKLAQANNYVSEQFGERFEGLLEKLPDLMPTAEPALLHGDLWNGNVMPGMEGKAYFFDPAVYYGAREMDLAMTRLFGGFEKRFYDAYQAVYPLPYHFEELVDLYNLYSLMVHVNLMGAHAGYVGSVERIINRYR
ncbi:MAG: fructosamine kinase family protein [Roseivirga sp.]